MNPPTPKYHCWSEGRTSPDGCPTTCMRPFGHEGRCHYERDDQIAVSFSSWADAFLREDDDLPCEVGAEWRVGA